MFSSKYFQLFQRLQHCNVRNAVLKCEYSILQRHPTRSLYISPVQNVHETCIRCTSSVCSVQKRLTGRARELGSESCLFTNGSIYLVPKRSKWYLKGLRSQKIQPTKPLNFDYSGDHVLGLPEIDNSQPRLEYTESDELKSANDQVKRIHSLEFGSGKDVKKYNIEEIVKKVHRHDGDYTSPEAKVAILTMKIRNQIKYCLARRKDKRAKSCLVERIQKRKKILKRMRKGDYETFERLLKELQITYVPPPEYYRRVTYKRTLKKAAWEKAEDIRGEKLQEFRQSLEKERQEFYAQKEEILADIEKQLKELDLHGPTLLHQVEESEDRQARKENSRREQFKKKFPAANNKYITMTIKE